jgi:hypothetical protein
MVQPKITSLFLDPDKIFIEAMIDTLTEEMAEERIMGQWWLFVELLFTAPRNRPQVRRDGLPWLRGVGMELLTWAAHLSRTKGYGGRLLLDGSPEFIEWYAKRGLQKLDCEPILYEGVSYVPMELSATSAKTLLERWRT